MPDGTFNLIRFRTVSFFLTPSGSSVAASPVC